MHGLVSPIYLFLAQQYIFAVFFPPLIALMAVSTAFFFAFMQLNAFQHQRSFATPPILSALPSCRSRCFCLQVSNCTVKNFQRVKNGLNTSDVVSLAPKQRSLFIIEAINIKLNLHLTIRDEYLCWTEKASAHIQNCARARL